MLLVLCLVGDFYLFWLLLGCWVGWDWLFVGLVLVDLFDVLWVGLFCGFCAWLFVCVFFSCFYMCITMLWLFLGGVLFN